MGARPLETGWLPDTPVDDSVLRRFVFNQADANAVIALAGGGRVDATDDVSLGDSGGPVPYYNQAILRRPLAGHDDAVLDVVDGFFASLPTGTTTLLSVWLPHAGGGRRALRHRKRAHSRMRLKR